MNVKRYDLEGFGGLHMSQRPEFVGFDDYEQLQARCKELETKAKRFQGTAQRLDAQYTEAMREAKSLAMTLWRRYFREESPNFSLCGDVAGIISQIDNMVAGITEEKEQLKVRCAELSSKARELAIVVENREEIPPTKWALKCVRLVNEILVLTNCIPGA